jgi:hypothetical protein
MRPSIRLAALVLVFGALVGAAWSQPALIEELGRTLGGGDARRLAELERNSAELTRRTGLRVRRIEAKEATIEGLIAGRLTLLEAARCFKDLEAGSDDRAADLADSPRLSDDERLCRQVLDWVHIELGRLPPSQAAAVWRRLEDQLNDNRRCHGGSVVLPEA